MIITAIQLVFIWRIFHRMNEKILEKIKKKQKTISTNLNLRKYSYILTWVNKKGIQIWLYYLPKSKSLEEKIKSKQKNITINTNLRKFGYIPTHKQKKWKSVLDVIFSKIKIY